jgi:hypothetical protein
MYSKEVAKEYPKNVDERGGPQLFCARPPGYSNNRQLAIVFIGFGWSNNFHPVLARYILIKDNCRSIGRLPLHQECLDLGRVVFRSGFEFVGLLVFQDLAVGIEHDQVGKAGVFFVGRIFVE